MRALYPPNSDILFNAIFLKTLPEDVRSALYSYAKLPSYELAESAIQLQHTIPPSQPKQPPYPLPPLPTPPALLPPPKLLPLSLPSSSPKLCDASGKTNSSWTFIEKTLQFGKNTFKHLFLQADVSQAIIGLDFLHANSIKIDAKNHRALFPTISFPIPLFSTSVSPSNVPLPVSSVSTHKPDILSILKKFPSVTKTPSIY
jgi:hypothetical protein